MQIPLRLERGGRPLRASLAASFRSELDGLEIPRWFTAAENQSIASFRFPRRRESYLLGRFAAKRALLDCGACQDPREIEIRKGVFEQPLPVPTTTELSIAHASGAAVALVCALGHPIGIDLELAVRGRIDFLESSFTEAERRRFERLPGPLERSLLVGWSLKESLAKALRCGLMTPLPIMEISTLTSLPDDSVEVEFTNFAQFKARAWRLQDFNLAIAFPKRTRLTAEFGPECGDRFAAR